MVISDKEIEIIPSKPSKKIRLRFLSQLMWQVVDSISMLLILLSIEMYHKTLKVMYIVLVVRGVQEQKVRLSPLLLVKR